MPASASRPTRILIVDDNPEMRELICLMLSGRGYHLSQAGSGRQALRLAEAERPDLILLDVMLPDVSGYEVCARLRQADPPLGCRIVMVSALLAQSAARDGLSAGADEFWRKPIGPIELRRGVERVLATAAVPAAYP